MATQLGDYRNSKSGVNLSGNEGVCHAWVAGPTVRQTQEFGTRISRNDFLSGASSTQDDGELCGFGDFVGFGGLVLEEAEGGVALAENASSQQAADALGELEGTAVLGDDDAALA
jgi:hypothetical protein